MKYVHSSDAYFLLKKHMSGFMLYKLFKMMLHNHRIIVLPGNPSSLPHSMMDLESSDEEQDLLLKPFRRTVAQGTKKNGCIFWVERLNLTVKYRIETKTSTINKIILLPI